MSKDRTPRKPAPKRSQPPRLPTPGFLLYQSPDGRARLSVRLEGQTVWLTQAQMAELFQTSKQNISLHIRNVLEEKELPSRGTVKDYLTVQMEGARSVERSVEHYSLDMIIAVGYRVRSGRGTQFRQWATGLTPLTPARPGLGPGSLPPFPPLWRASGHPQTGGVQPFTTLYRSRG